MKQSQKLVFGILTGACMSFFACAATGGSNSSGGSGGSSAEGGAGGSSQDSGGAAAGGSGGNAGSMAGGSGGSASGGSSSGGSNGMGGATNMGGMNRMGGANGMGGSVVVGAWALASTGLAGLNAMCGSSGAIAASVSEDRIFAQIAVHGIYTSVDGGASWALLAGGTSVTHSGSAFILDRMDSTRIWEIGNHNAMNVFASKDGGTTFQNIDRGVLPGADYLSVDFADPARKIMLVGPHEISKQLWRSGDGGASWTNIGAGLPGGTFCSTPLVIDPTTYVVGCTNSEIYRTTDGGSTWTRVSTAGANRAPVAATDGSIYWVGNGGGVIRSADGGKTWAQVLGNGMARVVPPIELPDGRIAVVGTSGIMLTADQGAHWVKVTTAPPVTPWTFTYSKYQKSFFAAYGVCNTTNVIPNNVVTKFAFDYELK